MATPAKQAPSPQQLDQLEALTAWLRTFEGCEEIGGSGCGSPIQMLQDVRFVSFIVAVAEQLFDKQASRAEESSVDSYWGSLFGLVTSVDPSVLQQLAGRRVSTLELRILMLSKLMCYCISERCKNRRTHIAGIMILTDRHQLVLKGIVESGAVLASTPVKKPAAAHSATTPRSSGSRRNLDLSFASPTTTPSRSRLFASPLLPALDEQDPMLLHTLMAWLQTNPEMDRAECSRIEHLDSGEVVW